MRYTEEEKAFILAQPSGVSNKEITERLNAHFGTDYTIPRIADLKRRIGGPKKELLYTPEILQFVKDHAEGLETSELQEIINKKWHKEYTWDQIKALRKRLKAPANIGGGRWEKGHVPFTKGKKLEEYCTDPEAIRRVQSTQFKKGNVPANHTEVGTIRWRQSYRGDCNSYFWIKVAEPRTWKLLHQVIWSEEHGPIPKGMKIAFINGDHTDLRLENLAAIDDATNAYRNLRKLVVPGDDELSRIGLLTAQLQAKYHNLLKKEK